MIGGVVLFIVVTALGSYGDSPASSMIRTPNMASCQSLGERITQDIASQRKRGPAFIITFTCQDIRP